MKIELINSYKQKKYYLRMQKIMRPYSILQTAFYLQENSKAQKTTFS